LVELPAAMGIAAMGIAAILAAITFGPMEGVRAAQNQPQAKAEPAAMAQALERFKTTYGFYPHAEETKYRQPVSGGLKK